MYYLMQITKWPQEGPKQHSIRNLSRKKSYKFSKWEYKSYDEQNDTNSPSVNINHMTSKMIQILQREQNEPNLNCYTIWQTLMIRRYPYLTTNNCICFFLCPSGNGNNNVCKGLNILERFMHYKNVRALLSTPKQKKLLTNNFNL